MKPLLWSLSLLLSSGCASQRLLPPCQAPTPPDPELMRQAHLEQQIRCLLSLGPTSDPSSCAQPTSPTPK